MIPNKNTFCIAPWYSLYLNSDKKLAPCCKFKETSKYNYNQLDEYFDSDELKHLREDLLNGIKNKSCISCWKEEEANGDSLRLVSNRTIALGTKIRLLDQVP